MNKDNSGRSFVAGAILGALAGVAVGFLTAPKSGKETRDELEQKGKKWLKDIEAEEKKKGWFSCFRNREEQIEEPEPEKAKVAPKKEARVVERVIERVIEEPEK